MLKQWKKSKIPRRHQSIWCSVTLSHRMKRSTDPHIPLACTQLCDLDKPGSIFKPRRSGALQQILQDLKSQLEVSLPQRPRHSVHQNLFLNLTLVPNWMFYSLLFPGKKPTFSDKVSCFSGWFVVLVFILIFLVLSLFFGECWTLTCLL